MWPNPPFPVDLVTFTEEILHGKLHFLCSARIEPWSTPVYQVGYWEKLFVFCFWRNPLEGLINSLTLRYIYGYDKFLPVTLYRKLLICEGILFVYITSYLLSKLKVI